MELKGVVIFFGENFCIFEIVGTMLGIMVLVLWNDVFVRLQAVLEHGQRLVSTKGVEEDKKSLGGL